MRWYVLLLLAGCVEAQELVCGDLICPTGDVCVAPGLCATSASVAACTSQLDGATCMTPDFSGTCAGGVCKPPVCGDGVIEGSEECDGPVTGVDCVDFGFELGTPTCNARCDLDVIDTCGVFGWKRILTEDTAPASANAWTDGTRFAIARASESQIDVYVNGLVTESATIGASNVTGNGHRIVAWGGSTIWDDASGSFATIDDGQIPLATSIDFVRLTDDDTLYVVLSDHCQILQQSAGTWSTIRAAGPNFCIGFDATDDHVAVAEAQSSSAEIEEWTNGTWISRAPTAEDLQDMRFVGDSLWVTGSTVVRFTNWVADYTLTAAALGTIVPVGSDIYIGGGNALLRIDAAGHAIPFTPPSGSPFTDGTHLYTATPSGIDIYLGTQFGSGQTTQTNAASDIAILGDGYPAVALGIMCVERYGAGGCTSTNILATRYTTVAGRSSTDLYGANPTTLDHYDGASTTTHVTPPGFTGIADLYVPPTGEPSLYAVGAAGLTLVLDAGTWSTIPPAATCDLTAIDGAPIYAVGTCGTQGVVWSLVDNTWIEVYRNDVPLSAVSVAPDGTVHAAGPTGGARFVNNTWEAVPDARGVSISATSQSDVWVAGGPQDVIHWDGLTWSRLAVTNAFRPRVAATPNAVYLLGTSESTLLR